MPRIGYVSAIQQAYRWEIDDFSDSFEKKDDMLTSPKFSTDDGTGCKWEFWLFPKGYGEEEHNGYMDISLCNCSDKEITAIASITILNQENAVVDETTIDECTYNTVCDEESYESTNNGSLFMRAKLDFILDKANGVLSDGKLIIEGRILIDPKKNGMINQIKTHKKQVEIDSQRLQEFDKLEHLIDNKDFSDVSLDVNGRVLFAHKNILASKSPVFYAMFKTDMREAQLNEVEIEDIDYNVVLEMLRYMYIGKVEGMQAIAGDLLAAADKYALDGLKIMCGKSLLANLNIDNAVGSLNIADLYRMDDLKAKIIQFIVSHSKDIANKPVFKTLTADVLDEICRAINNKKN